MTTLPFTPRCPTCDQTVAGNPKFMPFCSERCRLIDLGRWLSEENAIVVDRSNEEEGEQAESGRPALPPGWHDA